jgi:hypothetical protein
MDLRYVDLVCRSNYNIAIVFIADILGLTLSNFGYLYPLTPNCLF